jgi:IS30 family transposase
VEGGLNRSAQRLKQGVAMRRPKKRSYRVFEADERRQLFASWRAGSTVQQLSEALGRDYNSVRMHLMSTGGFSPKEPKPDPRFLNEAEREVISRGVAAKRSLRCIAAELGRVPSTVSREIERNGGLAKYRCVAAQLRASQQKARPKPCKLAKNLRLQRVVTKMLMWLWSPEQISGWLKLQSSDPSMQVSHEAIYKTLFVQARGALKAELTQCLRTERRMRHGKPATTTRRGQIPGAVSISERPPSVEDRAVPGHWEGDLIAGTQNSFIATLVERTTRFVILAKIESKETDHVIDALIREMKNLPAHLRKTLTLDRGSEFTDHARFTVATDLKVFFCDPRSPWQRGSNENTNGLLRQYFPKGKDVSCYSQADLNRVASSLNGRPRQTLGFLKPSDKLRELLR